jgi:hypothetical protein
MQTKLRKYVLLSFSEFLSSSLLKLKDVEAKEVKFSCSLIKHHTMKRYGGMEV